MADTKKLEGTIFDIQGFSVHDGPGCRTLIFLKGCPLSCSWCCNPEGMNPFPEVMFNASNCISDFNCVKACKLQAITWENTHPLIQRNICHDCIIFDCTTACYTGALQKAGYKISLDQILQQIRRDRNFWGDKGGITLSGGEPLARPEWAVAILQYCYNAMIHTAIETCGCIPFTHYEKVLPYLDWIFFDLKHMDDALHREKTGKSNRLILKNALRLATQFTGRLIFRMPVIKGFNDNKVHILQLATFIRKTGKNEINILPLHHLGREKYAMLGKEYRASQMEIPTQEEMENIQAWFTAEGIRCYIGSNTPF